MNKELYEILDICLSEMESGVGVDELLAQYPEYESQLRPILEASLEAQSLAVPAPSGEVIRRSRVRIMQRLAQMRAETNRPFARFIPMRRTVVTFALGLIIFMSGTNLVRASSGTIPGDDLYPVKRSWENVILFFAVDPQTKNNIRIKYERERLDELNELFADSRSASVGFTGRVTKQNGNGWWIADVLVIVAPNTTLPDHSVNEGDAVRVSGYTRGDGLVLASTIELLPASVPVPEVDVKNEPNTVEEQPILQMPGLSPTTVPDIVQNETPEPVIENGNGNTSPTDVTNPPEILQTKTEDFAGVLKSIKGDIWKINGINMNVADAVIQGVPSVGAHVKVTGYYQSNGVFVVTTIEITNSDNNSVGDNGNVNSNDNSEINNGQQQNGNGHDYNNNDNNDNYDNHESKNDNSNYNSNDHHNENDPYGGH